MWHNHRLGVLACLRFVLTPTACASFVCTFQTKHRTHVDDTKVDDDKIPRTFVLKRGRTDTTVVDLVENLKRVMAPYTALKLKARKYVVQVWRNTIIRRPHMPC